MSDASTVSALVAVLERLNDLRRRMDALRDLYPVDGIPKPLHAAIDKLYLRGYLTAAALEKTVKGLRDDFSLKPILNRSWKADGTPKNYHLPWGVATTAENSPGYAWEYPEDIKQCIAVVDAYVPPPVPQDVQHAMDRRAAFEADPKMQAAHKKKLTPNEITGVLFKCTATVAVSTPDACLAELGAYFKSDPDIAAILPLLEQLPTA